MPWMGKIGKNGIQMMNRPTRGEVWLVELDPTKGQEMQKIRPAAVIHSTTLNNQALRIIVPITTCRPKHARWLFLVFLQKSDSNGLDSDSGANTMQLRCVSIERMVRKLGELAEEDMQQILAGVALCIDFMPPTGMGITDEAE